MVNKNHNRQRLENAETAISAALRALSHRPNTELSFGVSNQAGLMLSKNKATLRLPSLTAENSRLLKGEADSSAFYLAYHHSELHREQLPKSEGASALFDAAEQARYLSLGMRHFKGSVTHVGAYLEDHYQTQGTFSQEQQDIPMAELLKLIMLHDFAHMPIPPSAKAQYDDWSPVLRAKAKQLLPELETQLASQSDFGDIIKRMIQQFGIDNEQPDTEQKEQQEEEADPSPPHDEDSSKNTQEESMQTVSSAGKQDGEDAGEMEGHMAEEGTEEQAESEGEEAHHHQHNAPIKELPPRYKVFTKQFDEVIPAERLTDEHELSRLRHQLDQKLENIKQATRRHANHFLRKLLAQRRRRWQFNLDEGVLDSARLALAVADPSYSYYYKQEVDIQEKDTLVTLLIDNSGSMRGRPITVAAMSADILAKTLEACGIQVEILGFTSREWKGGKTRRLWQEQGSQSSPGRLNDLRHIIYKSSQTPWRRARKNLGLMLKEGILKENIDGEAILWAASRMSGSVQKRRILMVISDGAPVDDSTLSTNGSDYLDRHLRDVIHFIENKTEVELLAIGIGHDVTRYYQRAVTIREVDDLGSAMFEQLAGVMVEQKA